MLLNESCACWPRLETGSNVETHERGVYLLRGAGLGRLFKRICGESGGALLPPSYAESGFPDGYAALLFGEETHAAEETEMRASKQFERLLDLVGDRRWRVVQYIADFKHQGGG